MRELYVGIDIGSVSINCLVLDQHKNIVHEYSYMRHFGAIEERVHSLLSDIFERFGRGEIRAVAFTGNHGRKISENVGGFYEFDTISQVLGSLYVKRDVRSIISMGGQDTALFQIKHRDGSWELEYFNTNGPCASGTGSFIDQQAQRLATSIYKRDVDLSQEQIDSVLKDFIELGLKSTRPSNVACRCTVFTKSDMIHLQNKGEKLEDIIYGLHIGNARNFISTIVANRRVEDPVIFIGGLSLNQLQVKAFKEYFSNILVPPHSTSIGALGVAIHAMEQGVENSIDLDGLLRLGRVQLSNLPIAPRLKLKLTRFPEENEVEKVPFHGTVPVYLGVDIGSTTTKYAIIDEHRRIIHKRYVHTQGRPVEVTQKLLSIIRDEIGRRIDIKGVATTGSGRNVVGDFLNADLIVDEITAHARGAVEIDPTVDTIFEIGGQDSKYIYIMNTYPLDFDMNKVCAAGTGSFLHELANKYGINIVGEFQEIAMSSPSPIRLAERCTVFMESDLVSYHQMGVEKRNLIAGLCYAIVSNYLNRVVGKRKIGERIMFLGGPSLNKAVVAAFENILNRAIIVPKHREVLGAFGAAILVQQKMRREGKKESRFRGLDSAINDRMEYKEVICRADPKCHNQCKLKIYNFDGRKSIWGGECGRYEISERRAKRSPNYFKLRSQIWERYMEGVYVEFNGERILEVDGRSTVGMQRALYTLHTGVLWAHFFDRLGLRVVLTPPTNSRIVAWGIESMTAETCFPVKISHGHIRYIKDKTRFLFIPSIINMRTPTENEAGFYCPMVQANQYMVRMAFNLKGDNILNPIVHLKYEPERLAVELTSQLSHKIGKSKKDIRDALIYALEIQEEFTKELLREGEKILSSYPNDKPLVIVTGRPYNLYDERLNLRLGENLSKIGVSALPMDFIDTSRVDLSDFSSMYWGFGSMILRAARYIVSSENLFGIHVTNFSCGADSFIEHFYKYIMQDKPYLILELDEHSAVAGIMTRLEAYRNVVENCMEKAKEGFQELKISNY